ncbi:MAG: prevent-host-death protein [Coriobacteriia bacterium]|nr:prevent-host-death protein [Coriobacteriia bacterium]
MVLVSSRELTSRPRETWERLAQEGELTITRNGQPAALMIDVDAESYDNIVRLLRQAKATRLIALAREEAARRGFMSADEIAAEIQAARQEAR